MSGYVVKPMIYTTTKGREVEVPGLGLLKNGQDNEISAEQAEYFRNYRGRWTKDDKGNDVWEQGPTVTQYFENTEWIEVSTAKEEKPVKAEKSEPAKAEGGTK